MDYKENRRNGRSLGRRGLALLALSGLLLLSGCSSDGKNGENTATPAPAVTESQPVSTETVEPTAPTAEDLGLTPEEMDTVKYNIYVLCGDEQRDC